MNVSVRSDGNGNLDEARSCFSQPSPAGVSFDQSITPYESEIHSFSQPTQIDNLLLSSQLVTSQSISTPDVIKLHNLNFKNVCLIKFILTEIYSELSQENDKVYFKFNS